MEDTLIAIVRENIGHGPRDIRALSISPEMDRVPQSIGQKYAFDSEDTLIIKNAATLALAGVLPPQNIPTHLSDILSIPDTQSRDIAEELDMKLFAKVRASLDSLYSDIVLKKTEPILPPPPPPPPAARRIIPTHTIIAAPKNQLVRPVTTSMNVQPIIQKKDPLGAPTVQTNTATLIKKPPFNTPTLSSPTAPYTPRNNPGVVSGPELGNDILSAKLSKPVNNPSTNDVLGKQPARSYGVDPYREPVE